MKLQSLLPEGSCSWSRSIVVVIMEFKCCSKTRNEAKKLNNLKQEATPKILILVVAKLYIQYRASSLKGHKAFCYQNT